MPPVEAPPPPAIIMVTPADDPLGLYMLRLSKRGYGRPWIWKDGKVWWQQLPEGNYLPWVPRPASKLNLY